MDQRRKAADVDTREKLLGAVRTLMTDRGSTEISLSEIATCSGVNASLVKYYFVNKGGLMVEVLRRTLGPKLKQMDNLAEMNISASEKLRIHISGIVTTYYETPFVNRLMHTMIAEGEEYDRLIAEEFSKPIGELHRKIIDQGVAEGLFQPVDPVFLYMTIIGTCDQFFFSRHQLKSVFGIERIDNQIRQDFGNFLFRTILNGISQRPASI